MKKIVFISAFLLTAFCSLLKAQSSLGVDTSYSIASSSNIGDSTFYKINIINYGPQSFTGDIEVLYLIDSTGTGNYYPLDTLAKKTGTSITIGMFGTFADSAMAHIVANKYRSGINTVVIWPRQKSSSTPFTTHDTLKVQVLAVNPTGIENYAPAKLILFPNPAQHILYITNTGSNIAIEQVRIMDIYGQLVYTEKFKGSIDVNKLTSGSYTLELLDKAGKVSRYKVIKE